MKEAKEQLIKNTLNDVLKTKGFSDSTSDIMIFEILTERFAELEELCNKQNYFKQDNKKGS